MNPLAQWLDEDSLSKGLGDVAAGGGVAVLSSRDVC